MPVAGSTTGTGAPTGAPVTGAAGVVTVSIALPPVPTVGAAPPKLSAPVPVVTALPILALPTEPLVALSVSSLATITVFVTVTVIVAGLQFVGCAFSHKL